MLLSPRSRRTFDVESSTHTEHVEQEHGARHRTLPQPTFLSPRLSSGGTAARQGRRPSSPFPSTSPPPSGWPRRSCSSSTVTVLATACLCTLIFCLLHVYLTDTTSAAEPLVLPRALFELQQQQQPVPPTVRTQQARRQRLLATVEACLQRHPSYPDTTDTSPAPHHTRRARPFPPLPADCTASLSLSVHEQSVLQFTLLIRRLHASNGELDYFDLLTDRLSNEDGPTALYAPLPSAWLVRAAWDEGLTDTGSPAQSGGDCELVQLGQGQYAHQQSIYALTDATALVDPHDKHLLHLSTIAQPLNASINLCSPTAGQLLQEQDNITLSSTASLPPTNASYAPRPPVTYMLSRHNSRNPWHTLIEHIYPQWLQMFLRGDFPYTFDQLTAAFTHPAAAVEPALSAAASQPHYDLFVYHETGHPNGPMFDGWWHTLLGAPVRYLRAGDSVSCSLCIFGPPKLLAVYDYWGGSRFVYDSATHFAVRLFRRHVYARVDVAPWRRRADDAPPVLYSFQRSATTYWRPRGGQEGSRTRVEYVLPDFPRLLASERLAQSTTKGRDVKFSELTPSGFDFGPLADPSRSILIAGNYSRDGWPADSGPLRYTALSTLPLVVLTRRHVNNTRTLRPFTNFLSFYQQPAVLASLPYHLLLVYIEELPLADQVALLSSAALLLTVEGASEVNQLYLPLRSVVVEVECERRFYDGSRPRPWHQSLGQYLGHLFVQWSVEGCDEWDDAKGLRLHELLVRLLESAERNRYVYMS